MSPILLSGFGPFDIYTTNPSEQVARHLHQSVVNGRTVHGIVLPVRFGDDFTELHRAIESLQPSTVICMGLNPTASCLQVEHLAVNLRHRDPDTTLVRIEPDGPAALFATIDVDGVCAAINQSNVPARPHTYGGHYLCNHIFYRTLRFATHHPPHLRVGFIHLPIATDDVIDQGLHKRPSLPLEMMCRGVTAALGWLGENRLQEAAP